MPGDGSWAQGQHFLLNILSINRATLHPFSVENVHDEQSPQQRDEQSSYLYVHGLDGRRNSGSGNASRTWCRTEKSHHHLRRHHLRYSLVCRRMGTAVYRNRRSRRHASISGGTVWICCSCEMERIRDGVDCAGGWWFRCQLRYYVYPGVCVLVHGRASWKIIR